MHKICTFCPPHHPHNKHRARLPQHWVSMLRRANLFKFSLCQWWWVRRSVRTARKRIRHQKKMSFHSIRSMKAMHTKFKEHLRTSTCLNVGKMCIWYRNEWMKPFLIILCKTRLSESTRTFGKSVGTERVKASSKERLLTNVASHSSIVSSISGNNKIACSLSGLSANFLATKRAAQN